MNESEQQRRLSWRCRRGMLELDNLLQNFLVTGYSDLAAQERNAFMDLLDYPDPVLYELLMGRSVSCHPEYAHVIEKIRQAVTH